MPRDLRFLQHDAFRIGRHVVKQQAIKHAARPPPEAGSILLKDDTRGALYGTLPVDQDDVCGHALVFQLLGSLDPLPGACTSPALATQELQHSLLMPGMTTPLLSK